MVAKIDKRRECKCVLCGHDWVSLVKNPKQCPVCRRKDWDGLHNSMGKLLAAAGADECHCARCGYDWSPRKPDPVQCPRCKRYDWLDGASAPVAVASGGLRGGRYQTRMCQWCEMPFEDDTKGRRAGMCGRCGTDWHTGEDVAGTRWSKERWAIERNRMDDRGRIVVPHTALRPVDPFDPDGLLAEQEGLL